MSCKLSRRGLGSAVGGGTYDWLITCYTVKIRTTIFPKFQNRFLLSFGMKNNFWDTVEKGNRNRTHTRELSYVPRARWTARDLTAFQASTHIRVPEIRISDNCRPLQSVIVRMLLFPTALTVADSRKRGCLVSKVLGWSGCPVRLHRLWLWLLLPWPKWASPRDTPTLARHRLRPGLDTLTASRLENTASLLLPS